MLVTMQKRWGIAMFLAAGALFGDEVPTRQQVLDAMRKAVGFYVDQVSKEGGYHFVYAEDLSYGRSEQGDGLMQIETQREGTPRVGMAFLEAYDATGDRFFLEAARKAAQALVKGQLCSGGWDYIVEFDPEKRPKYPYRADRPCDASTPQPPPSTLDDNVTQAAVRLLMRVDRALGFQDREIHDAAQFALESLLKAQYPNGAWPQRYSKFPDPSQFPVKKASYPEDWPRQWPGEVYKTHYTFNDNSIQDAIDMMLEAARVYGDRRFVESARRGGDFILSAQMPEPQPAWAQQYDAEMHPAWARIFEPPSVTGGESQSVMRALLLLYRETGDRRYLDAVPKALNYLERSVLPPASGPVEARRRFKPGEPVLARFYELKTNRPLYITKGSRVSARGMGSKLLDGYELSYADESVITHYNVLTSGAGLAEIRREYERLAGAAPSTLRRPDKLHGLSPWEQRDTGPLAERPAVERVRIIIGAMDPRGAWLEDGVIGKADRIVSVYAARDMVLTVNGKATPIRENDQIELYQGAKPPRTRIIRSTTFAENLETLAAWVSKEGSE